MIERLGEIPNLILINANSVHMEIKVEQNILIEQEEVCIGIIIDTDQGIYYGLSYIIKKREERLIKDEVIRRYKLIRFIKEELNKKESPQGVSKLPLVLLKELDKYHGEDIAGAVSVVKDKIKQMKQDASQMYREFVDDTDIDWHTVNTIIDNGIKTYLRINNLTL